MRWFGLIILLLVACQSPEKEKQDERVEIVDNEVEVIVEEDEHASIDSMVSARMAEIGLVDLKTMDTSILVDLRYASTNNFMEITLYDTLNALFLQRDVAERLVKCQELLDSLKPNYRLLVYDGVRPRQVQQEMWDALDSIPIGRRGKFVSNPRNGSVHNFGAAVDLTIVDDKGVELDMGAGYDDFREIAFPSKESYFLATGELSIEQLNNRRLLRRVMRSQRFSNIPSEWWHFNAYSRVAASNRYQLLLTEGGESIWFKIAPKIETHSDSLK